MPSSYETFFTLNSFAVVGHSAHKPFPRLTFGGLQRRGKTVYAVDPSVAAIDGTPTFPDLASLPAPVEGVVIEVPRTETWAWVEQVVAAGIRHLWLHQTADTPEAVALAREHGVEVRTGTCAVQYLDDGFPHFVHRWVRQVLGRY